MEGGSSEMGIAVGKRGIINQEHVKVKTQGDSSEATQDIFFHSENWSGFNKANWQRIWPGSEMVKALLSIHMN